MRSFPKMLLCFLWFLALRGGGDQALAANDVDCADCEPKRQTAVIPLLFDPNLVPPKLYGYVDESVSVAEYLSLPCMRTRPLSENEILAWLRMADETRTPSRNLPKKDTKEIDANIHGIQFKNESPELLRLFRTLTTAKDLFNLDDSDRKNQRVFQSKCDKVICAVQEIFGKKVGPQLLYMLGRFGFNGSHLSKYRDTSAWKGSELDDVLLSLSAFPDTLWPMNIEYPLHHSNREMDQKGYPVCNAEITVFNNWESLPAKDRQQALIHELGHVLAGVKKLDESPEWKTISGWTQNNITSPDGLRTYVEHSKPDTFVSKYAKQNSAEDAAESILAYRVNPQLLKQASPEKYAIIRDTIFDGIEYQSEESCNLSHSYRKQLSGEAAKIVAGAQPQLGENLTGLKVACANELITAHVSMDEIRDCITEELSRGVVEKVLAQKAFQFPKITKQAIMGRPFRLSIAEEVVRESRALLVKATKEDYVRALGALFFPCGGKSETYCKEATEYGYLAAERSGFNFYGGNDSRSFEFTFSNKNELESVLEQACLLTQAGKKVPVSPTEEEIRQAIEQIFRK